MEDISRARKRSSLYLRSGFTLVEMMVAGAVAVLLMAVAMMFINFTGLSLSGTTGQTLLNGQAGYAIEFIQSRVRLATSVTNSNAGNTLTLGFDDDPTVDSDGDGKTYNDKDHYEQFNFVGANGSTNAASTNRLVYIPNIASSNQIILIPSRVHNLPGYNIFTVTNQVMAIIRFGMVDAYARDRFQGIDIQATAVSLNRPATPNIVSILP